MARERSVILDDDEPPAPKRAAAPSEHSRFGFEWGLASTIVGATFLMTGPLVMLLLMAVRPSYDDYYSGRTSTSRFEVATFVGIFGVIVLCILGFMFGLRGLGRARQHRAPAALPVTGMLFCFAAVCFWVVLAIAAAERHSSW